MADVSARGLLLVGVLAWIGITVVLFVAGSPLLSSALWGLLTSLIVVATLVALSRWSRRSGSRPD